MKYIGLYNVIMSAFVAATLSSCESFLDLGPAHSLTMENSVTDSDTAEEIVNGIYGKYESNSYLGGSLFGVQHCMAGLWDYYSTMQNMSYTQSGDDYTVNYVWSGLYGCINASNAAIQGVENLSESVFTNPDRKNELLAEARCFRGYCNLILLWMYGHWFDTQDSPYGIVYRDVPSELSNLTVPRQTVGESYRLILEDLEFAEKYALPYVSAKRMSKEFAKILHAKLLLVRGWDGDYAKSLALVNDVMATAPKAFAMETNLENLYKNGWNSKEVLFSRYLGDLTNFSSAESTYSYSLYYNNKFNSIVQDWLENDERSPIFFGTARAPETWDTSTKSNILVKLYHRGRYDGVNDMYATYVFRYAELYLMKAELLARTNPSNVSAALEQINLMRSTYTNPVLSPIQGITTMDELMDALFKEYATTLFLENETIWFASLRINHNGLPWICTLRDEANINKNKCCWPIPNEEMISNPALVGMQNPELE